MKGTLFTEREMKGTVIKTRGRNEGSCIYREREKMTGTENSKENCIYSENTRPFMCSLCIYRDKKMKGTVFTERKHDGICTVTEQ